MKLVSLINESLPGRRTRGELRKAAWPAPVVWMRTAMRMVIAGAFLIAGHRHLATIVAVLAVVNLLGAIEGQIASVLVKTWQSIMQGIARR